MSRIPKTKRQKPVKKKNRLRTIVTPQLRINVMNDFHANELPITRIAEKYSICRETVSKILRETDLKKDDFCAFNPADVFKRVDMSPIERVDHLSCDAIQAVELLLAAIRYKLHREIKFMADNEDKACSLTVKELTTLLTEAAPYALPRKDNPKKGKYDKEAPLGKVHRLFKTQVS